MKKFCGRYAHVLAAFALVMTTLISNSACHFIIYQEPLPKSAKKLRKF